jgi:hypothetical protein
MRAAGVNPVETYIRAGTYAKLPSLPYTPGGEGTGDVEAVGEGVIKFKVRMIFYCYDNWYSMLTIFCSLVTGYIWPEQRPEHMPNIALHWTRPSTHFLKTPAMREGLLSG